MPRFPLIPTILVLAACATMVALGIWQLGRADEKEALIADYSAALENPDPAISISRIDHPEAGVFRRVTYNCLTPIAWRGIAGRNRDGQNGYAHYFTCTGGNNVAGAGTFEHTVEVGIGWSNSPDRPDWQGGPVEGLTAPGGAQGFILIADRGLAGLEPLARPDPNDLPNNHLAYAVQWFFFAATAMVIYVLALKRRQRSSGG